MDDFSKNAFTSWIDSYEELGSFIDYEEVDPQEAIKKDGTNYVVTLKCDFEKEMLKYRWFMILNLQASL